MKHGLMRVVLAGMVALTALAARAADPTAISSAPAVAVSPIAVLDNDVLCLRPSRVSDNLAGELFSTLPTNRIAGTILDLRFADGDASAVDPAVKLFTSHKVPLVILANGETRGGAAVLAERLRSIGTGVIIGSTNVPGLVSPDIAVDVSAEVEKGFQANPYMTIPTTGTALTDTNDLMPIIDHTSEAELVRKKIKDGDEDDTTPTARPEPGQPIIRDPAMARAVDLIRAIEIFQTRHS